MLEYSVSWNTSLFLFCLSKSLIIPVLNPLRSIPVRRPQSENAGSKAVESRPAQRPAGFSLDAAAVSGSYAGAVDGAAVSRCVFSFNSVR